MEKTCSMRAATVTCSTTSDGGVLACTDEGVTHVLRLHACMCIDVNALVNHEDAQS